MSVPSSVAPMPIVNAKKRKADDGPEETQSSTTSGVPSQTLPITATAGGGGALHQPVPISGIPASLQPAAVQAAAAMMAAQANAKKAAASGSLPQLPSLGNAGGQAPSLTSLPQLPSLPTLGGAPPAAVAPTLPLSITPPGVAPVIQGVAPGVGAPVPPITHTHAHGSVSAAAIAAAAIAYAQANRSAATGASAQPAPATLSLYPPHLQQLPHGQRLGIPPAGGAIPMPLQPLIKKRRTKSGASEAWDAPATDGKLKGKFTVDEKKQCMDAFNRITEQMHLSQADVKTLLTRKGRGAVQTDQLLWENVAAAVPTRTKRQVYSFCTRVLAKKYLTSGQWSQEDEAKLRMLVQTHGTKWATLAVHLNREPISIRDKWRELIPGDKRKHGDWSMAENTLLQQVISELSPPTDGQWPLEGLSWTAISARVQTRSAASCRNHWTNVLHPRLSGNQTWLIADDLHLVEAIIHQDVEHEQDVQWSKTCPKWGGSACHDRWRALIRPISEHRSLKFTDLLKRVRDALMVHGGGNVDMSAAAHAAITAAKKDARAQAAAAAAKQRLAGVPVPPTLPGQPGLPQPIAGAPFNPLGAPGVHPVAAAAVAAAQQPLGQPGVGLPPPPNGAPYLPGTSPPPSIAPAKRPVLPIQPNAIPLPGGVGMPPMITGAPPLPVNVPGLPLQPGQLPPQASPMVTSAAAAVAAAHAAAAAAALAKGGAPAPPNTLAK